MGSPPPDGSKNVVLKFRSVNNIVIAPARTGKERSNRTAVIPTDHTNNGMYSIFMKFGRMFIIVVIKLMAPRMEEAPAKWSLKIARSTEIPFWNRFDDSGGYTVHPVPTPVPANEEILKRVREGGRSQKLILFIRGKAISCTPIINGSSQLPNPPIMIGITMKKIIMKAWAVTIVLYI
jgi:hypothetical protein